MFPEKSKHIPLTVSLEPWRTDADYILCPCSVQRSQYFHLFLTQDYEQNSLRLRDMFLQMGKLAQED